MPVDQTFPAGPAFSHLSYLGTIKLFGVNDVASPALSGWLTPNDLVAAAVAAVAAPGPATTSPTMDGTGAVGTSLLYARADHQHASDTSRAPTAAPSFTGGITVAGGAAVTGGTATDTLTATGAVTAGTTLTAGAAAATSAGVNLQGTAASARWLTILTGANKHWQLGLAGGTEGGSNAGGDLVINRFDDTGNLLGNVLTATRSTGLITVLANPTAALGIATKQYVDTAVVGGGGATLAVAGTDPVPGMDGTAAVGTSTKAAREDHVHASDTSRAPVAGPAFTGVATLTDGTAGASTTLTISAPSSTSGANVKLIGNGATTSSKTIRVSGGVLQLMSDTAATVLMQVDDAGNATHAGTLATSGAVTIADGANAATTLQVTNTGANGAVLKLTGNGGTTPSKSIRVQGGALNILSNSGAAIATLSDSGVTTIAGNTTFNTAVANQISTFGGSSGFIPGFQANGSDTNVGIAFTPKGTEKVYITSGGLEVRGASNRINNTGATSGLPATPTGSLLHVAPATASAAAVSIDGYAAAPGFLVRRSEGTYAAPTALAATSPIGGLIAQGYDGTAWSATAGQVQVQAGALWSATSHPTLISFGTTPASSTTLTERMRIMPTGNVIISSAGTADNGTDALQVVGSVSSTGAATIGGALAVNGGAATITDTGTTNAQQLTVAATLNTTGGASIKLTGNGGTTPSKFLQVKAGTFAVLNSAGNSALLSIDDSGNSSFLGTLTSGAQTVNGAVAITGTLGVTGTGAISDPGSAAYTLALNATSNASGARLKLVGNGATTPSKTLQVVGGTLNILNDAASSMASMTDAGAWTLASANVTGTFTVGGAAVALASALSGLAPIASPAFTGTPTTATTPTLGDNTTKLATTAFVQAALAGVTPVNPSATTPAMDGTATAGTAATYSRGDHVHPTDTSRAPLASPAFTGAWTGAGALTINLNAAAAIAAPAGYTFAETLQGPDTGSTNTGLLMTSVGSGQNTLYARTSAGTGATPTALTSNIAILRIAGAGYDGTAWSSPSAAVDMITGQNWSGTNHGTAIAFRTTANATTTLTERMRIFPSGNVTIAPAGPGTDDNTNALQVTGSITANGNTAVMPTGITSSTNVLFAGQASDAAGSAAAALAAYGTTAYTTFSGFVAGGTRAVPTAVASGQTLSRLGGGGYDGTLWGGTNGAVNVKANNAWTSTDHGTYIDFTVTPAGAVGVRTNVFRVAATGNLLVGGQNASLPTENNVDVIQTNGSVKITDSGANAAATLTVSNTGTNGANLKLSGNTASGTPSKTFRVVNGVLQVINDAYTAGILSLTDAGLLTPNDLVLATDTSQTAFSGAWAAWTPTITTGSGTGMTTATVARYKKIGRIVFWQLNLAITGVGTAAGEIIVTLPFSAQDYNGWGGREGVTGKGLTCHVVPSSSFLHISFYDVTSAIATGARMMISGTYEATT